MTIQKFDPLLLYTSAISDIFTGVIKWLPPAEGGTNISAFLMKPSYVPVLSHAKWEDISAHAVVLANQGTYGYYPRDVTGIRREYFGDYIHYRSDPITFIRAFPYAGSTFGVIVLVAASKANVSGSSKLIGYVPCLGAIAYLGSYTYYPATTGWFVLQKY